MNIDLSDHQFDPVLWVTERRSPKHFDIPGLQPRGSIYGLSAQILSLSLINGDILRDRTVPAMNNLQSKIRAVRNASIPKDQSPRRPK